MSHRNLARPSKLLILSIYLQRSTPANNPIALTFCGYFPQQPCSLQHQMHVLGCHRGLNFALDYSHTHKKLIIVWHMRMLGHVTIHEWNVCIIVVNDDLMIKSSFTWNIPSLLLMAASIWAADISGDKSPIDMCNKTILSAILIFVMDGAPYLKTKLMTDLLGPENLMIDSKNTCLAYIWRQFFFKKQPFWLPSWIFHGWCTLYQN